MQERDWLAERFEEHRGRLRAVAYRMLGSTDEADDAVQEAWIRLNRSDTGRVENLGGWLTTVQDLGRYGRQHYGVSVSGVMDSFSTIVANRLRGKHKPTFTPHMDMGDNVIVINADKVQITGDKRQNSSSNRIPSWPSRGPTSHRPSMVITLRRGNAS